MLLNAVHWTQHCTGGHCRAAGEPHAASGAAGSRPLLCSAEPGFFTKTCWNCAFRDPQHQKIQFFLRKWHSHTLKCLTLLIWNSKHIRFLFKFTTSSYEFSETHTFLRITFSIWWLSLHAYILFKMILKDNHDVLFTCDEIKIICNCILNCFDKDITVFLDCFHTFSESWVNFI